MLRRQGGHSVTGSLDFDQLAIRLRIALSIMAEIIDIRDVLGLG